MKKKILSQLMILSFAFAGLFLVENNVFGSGYSARNNDHLEPGDNGWKDHCEPVWTNDNCKVGNTIHTYMKPKTR